MPERAPESLSLDALLAGLVDETITPAELDELERRLDGDPEAQRRYLHYLDLHAELLEANPVRLGPPTRHGRVAWMTSVMAVAIPVAVIATLLLGAFLFSNRGAVGTPASAPLVEVVDVDGPVRWLDSGGERGEPIRAGLELPAGTLELISADSWVVFSFPDGTSGSMAGHSVVTISLADGQKTLRLQRGNLSVDAAKQPAGRPLRVITPSAEAEVLGTQFNVSADDYATRIVVNEGRVRVTRLADGEVEEVARDEVLVAALEQGSTFEAVPRREMVETWKAVLPRDVRQGRSEPGGVRAMPHLWRGEEGQNEKAILLYTVVLDPSPKRQAPFRLSANSRLTVQGRLAKTERLHLGFATHVPKGGFAGKYSLPKGHAVEPDASGHFAIELALDDFRPKTAKFPASPADFDVAYLWIQTFEVDAGLVVEQVEWGPKNTGRKQLP